LAPNEFCNTTEPLWSQCPGGKNASRQQAGTSLSRNDGRDILYINPNVNPSSEEN